MKQMQQVAVSGFILNDKKEVLFVKRSKTDEFLPGYWEVPGGGIDFGEHPLRGLKREIKEETGLDIIIDRPIHIDDYFMETESEEIHRVEIFFVCYKKDSVQEVMLSNEHSEYKWLGRESIKNIDMTDYQYKALQVFFKSV